MSEKAKLMDSLDVLDSIHAAIIDHKDFAKSEIGCNNVGVGLFFEMFDGTKWVMSAKDIKKIE